MILLTSIHVSTHYATRKAEQKFQRAEVLTGQKFPSWPSQTD